MECPLCKQQFNSIFHNIKENNEYDEYAVPIPVPRNEHPMEFMRLIPSDLVSDVMLARSRTGSALHNFLHRVIFKITVICLSKSSPVFYK